MMKIQRVDLSLSNRNGRAGKMCGSASGTIELRTESEAVVLNYRVRASLGS